MELWIENISWKLPEINSNIYIACILNSIMKPHTIQLFPPLGCDLYICPGHPHTDVTHPLVTLVAALVV
jgi:hypothetical protein